MPGEDFGPRVSNALTDAGGPTELTQQLVALNRQYGLQEEDLLNWIRFHIGSDWAGSQFEQWAFKLVETRKQIGVLEAMKNARK